MNPIGKFRLATVSDKFSDSEIEQLFLSLEIDSEETIQQAVDVLTTYRPKLAKRLELEILRPEHLWKKH